MNPVKDIEDILNSEPGLGFSSYRKLRALQSLLPGLLADRARVDKLQAALEPGLVTTIHIPAHCTDIRSFLTT